MERVKAEGHRKVERSTETREWEGFKIVTLKIKKTRDLGEKN